MIDYRRAFKIACELLNGDVLYGVDSDRIFEIMMERDGMVSNDSYEEYILSHLQELDHGMYAKREKQMNKEEVIRAIGELFFEKMQIGEYPTNGEMIKVLFPYIEVKDYGLVTSVKGLDCDEGSALDPYMNFWSEWWNAPYKAESEVAQDADSN